MLSVHTTLAVLAVFTIISSSNAIYSTAWVALSVTVNTMSTALIVGKLVYERRRLSKVLAHGHLVKYVTATAILVESAVPLTVVGIISSVVLTRSRNMPLVAVVFSVWFCLSVCIFCVFDRLGSFILTSHGRDCARSSSCLGWQWAAHILVTSKRHPKCFLSLSNLLLLCARCTITLSPILSRAIPHMPLGRQCNLTASVVQRGSCAHTYWNHRNEMYVHLGPYNADIFMVGPGRSDCPQMQIRPSECPALESTHC